MIKEHYIKESTESFNLIKNGKKQFLLKGTSVHNFKIYDEVYIQEELPITQDLTGRIIKTKITYVLDDAAGLGNRYCIFSFEILENIKIKPYPYDTIQDFLKRRNERKQNS